MFDLMNSKNSQGEYIFGGNQSKTQPFIKDASGNYVFQGIPASAIFRYRRRYRSRQ